MPSESAPHIWGWGRIERAGDAMYEVAGGTAVGAVAADQIIGTGILPVTGWAFGLYLVVGVGLILAGTILRLSARWRGVRPVA